MQKQLTEKDIEAIRLVIQTAVNQAIAGVDERLTGSIRDLKQHFDRRLSGIEDRLGVVETKLDAIMVELATRKELRNLVRELKAQGIRLDETKVFAS
jgi:uncharacterized protein YicC (UPF0701 family)